MIRLEDRALPIIERTSPKRLDRAEGSLTTPQSSFPIANQPGRVEFSDVLAEAVDAVRSSLGESKDAVADALIGRGTPHQAMLAMTKADITFRFVTQTRNKLVEAYRELINLQM